MESPNGTPPILEEARELICRVPPGYQSAELRVIFDAAQHIPRDEPRSHVDSRILHAADRLLSLFGEDSEPPPPTPYDSRIEEAAAVEAEKKAAFEAAAEARFERALDLDSLTGSGVVQVMGRAGSVAIWTGQGERGRSIPKREHVDAAEAALKAAQEAFELAKDDFRRARGAKNKLAHVRGRWRAIVSVAK